MNNLILLNYPDIHRADVDSVLRCLLDDALGKEGIATTFAHDIAEYCNMRHGLALRSFASAISFALQALQLAEGSRIGISPLAPALYHQILQEQNMEIVLIDVDKTVPLLPSPSEYDYLAAKLDALIIDTGLGLVADLHGFASLKIPLIEDLSRGLASSRLDVRAGSVGDVVLLSTEVEDMITTGGGAVILFREKRLKQRVQCSSQHMLPALNASLGLTQLSRLDQRILRKKQLLPLFDAAAAKSVCSPLAMPQKGAVFHRYPLLIKGSVSEGVVYAKKHRVEAQQVFRHCIATVEKVQTPHAQQYINQLIHFPFEANLTDDDVTRISAIIASIP